MPPSPRTSAGDWVIRSRKACQAAGVSAAVRCSSPTLWEWSSAASSDTAMSGRDSARPPTSSVSGVTEIWKGPSATAAVPAAVMRLSASWIAGCVAGYMATTRAAPLQARARSTSLALVSADSGSVAWDMNARALGTGSAVRGRSASIIDANAGPTASGPPAAAPGRW